LPALSRVRIARNAEVVQPYAGQMAVPVRLAWSPMLEVPIREGLPPLLCTLVRLELVLLSRCYGCGAEGPRWTGQERY